MPTLPSFTKDNFSNNIPRWERLVKPRLEKKSKLNILIIGVDEGRSSYWLLQKIPKPFKVKESRIFCIDRFSVDVHKRFKNNMKDYGDIVVDIKVDKLMREGLSSLPPKEKQFDLIFLDGMQAQELMEIMVMTFPMLKAQGMLVIDDNTNSKEHLPNCPKVAVDAFMYIYAASIKALDISWQAVMLKRSRPLKIKDCKSEYYHEDLDKI